MAKEKNTEAQGPEVDGVTKTEGVVAASAAKPTYEVVGIEKGPIVHKGKKIDLNTMTDAQAEWLIKTGCPFLVKK